MPKEVEMGLKERLEKGIYTGPACPHTQAPIAKNIFSCWL